MARDAAAFRALCLSPELDLPFHRNPRLQAPELGAVANWEPPTVVERQGAVAGTVDPRYCRRAVVAASRQDHGVDGTRASCFDAQDALGVDSPYPRTWDVHCLSFLQSLSAWSGAAEERDTAPQEQKQNHLATALASLCKLHCSCFQRWCCWPDPPRLFQNKAKQNVTHEQRRIGQRSEWKGIFAQNCKKKSS